MRCADGSLYTGWTNDLARRLRAHRAGTGARYTRGRLPVFLLAWWTEADEGAARRAEIAFKRLARPGKEAYLRARAVFSPAHAEAEPPRFVPKRAAMTTHTAPTGDELTTLATEAETAKARITTAKGDIVFSFYPHDARIHSAAFIKLARAGFYDGLAFHRYEPGFVIQGGDPAGNGTGGPGYKLDAEFNDKPHVKGTVAMARSQSPNSAGSQFYICLGEARFLDKQYTVFGQVTEGQDVVDQIRAGDVMERVTIE